VIGGRSDSLTGQTRAILAWTPGAAPSTAPGGFTDTAVRRRRGGGASGQILVLGGRDAAGRARDEILRLRPGP